MIISGEIIAVEKPDYTDPRWGNQYQNITIDTRDGPVEGRIGCKKPYTDHDIHFKGQWECEPDINSRGPYNKLKKYYAQPYRPPQGPTGGTAASPEQKVEEKVDWDAKERRNMLQTSYNVAVQLMDIQQRMGVEIEYTFDTMRGVASLIFVDIYKQSEKKWNPEDTPIRSLEVGGEHVLPADDDIPF